jgi:hypothetical protein
VPPLPVDLTKRECCLDDVKGIGCSPQRLGKDVGLCFLPFGFCCNLLLFGYWDGLAFEIAPIFLGGNDTTTTCAKTV